MAKYFDAIDEEIESHHGIGYVTYMTLKDKNPDLSIEECQNILLEFAIERIDEDLLNVYSIKCRKTGTNNYFSLLVSHERLFELIEDQEDYEFDPETDISVLMVASKEKGYKNYFKIGVNGNCINHLTGIGQEIEFIPPTNPVRAELRKAAIGNKKIESAKKGQSKIAQAPKSNPKVAFRKAESKAGTQMKIGSQFSKKESREAGLGVKRKREEMEKCNKEEELMPKPAENPEITKRSKRVDRDIENKKVVNTQKKAQFDLNLYSLEESDEEKPAPPSPKASPAKQIKKRRKRIESDEEEEPEKGEENLHPNGQDVEMEEEKPATKQIIKKKVMKSVKYMDEDGFECSKQVETYVEVEVDAAKVKPVKQESKVEKKKTKFKAPQKGQSSLTSFFGRG